MRRAAAGQVGRIMSNMLPPRIAREDVARPHSAFGRRQKPWLSIPSGTLNLLREMRRIKTYVEMRVEGCKRRQPAA
jgi:hypothetical protein